MSVRSLARRLRNRLRTSWRPFSLQMQYRILNRRIDRNQWSDDNGEAMDRVRDMLDWTWQETREKAPDYFARLDAAVQQTRGRIIEIGAGIGNMTQWIARRDEVEKVLALDAFESAVRELEARRLPKVEARRIRENALVLPPDVRFDTLVMCELIEHMYPDEEFAMLNELRPLAAEGARFVVSTPIGWLEDPFHVRGFSRARFRRHLQRHYGEVEGVDEASGYAQVAWGRFRRSP